MSEQSEIKLQVGKRYLFADSSCTGLSESYFEGIVLEISPSGKKIKMRYLGCIKWEERDDLRLVEELCASN